LTNLGQQIVDDILLPTVNELVQTGALAVTQVLADIANGNINLVGKRNIETDPKILNWLTNLGQQIVDDIILPTANQLVQTGALAVTQVLADIANGNINLVGKRNIETDPKILNWLTNLGQQIVDDILLPTANQLVQTGALAVTQVLADIANGNINLVGKRNIVEADPKILNWLTNLGQQIVDDILLPTVNELVQTGALAVTQVLADIANGNINLVGKRDEIEQRIFGLIQNTVNNLANQAFDIINSAVQTASFHIAVSLANIAENGLIGKRATF